MGDSRGASVVGVLTMLAVVAVVAIGIDSQSIAAKSRTQIAQVTSAQAEQCVPVAEGVEKCTAKTPTDSDTWYKTEITTGSQKETLIETLEDGIPYSSPEARDLKCEMGSDYILKGAGADTIIFIYDHDLGGSSGCIKRSGKSFFPQPEYLPGVASRNSVIGERYCAGEKNRDGTYVTRSERWQCVQIDCRFSDGRCALLGDNREDQRYYVGDPIIGEDANGPAAPAQSADDVVSVLKGEASDEEKEKTIETIPTRSPEERQALLDSFREEKARIESELAQNQKEQDELTDLVCPVDTDDVCPDTSVSSSQEILAKKQAEEAALRKQLAFFTKAEAVSLRPSSQTASQEENQNIYSCPGDPRCPSNDWNPGSGKDTFGGPPPPTNDRNDRDCGVWDFLCRNTNQPDERGELYAACQAGNQRACQLYVGSGYGPASVSGGNQGCRTQQGGGLIGTIISLFKKDTCSNNGNGTDSNAPTPRCTITASPQNPSAGQEVTLSWQSERAFSATLSSVGGVAPSGSMTVTPQTTTTYTLSLGGYQDNRTGQQLRGQCSVQVVVGGEGGGTGDPKAEISCQPRVADVGMSIAVSFACRNANTSVGSGFDTNGQLSGSATPVVERPTIGSDSIMYGLTCSKEGKTDSAQCPVQVNVPSIVLIANPKTVNAGAEANIGWITGGMESCTISSPTLAGFTQENAGNTSTAGVAKTPPLSDNATFVLSCTTKAGGTKIAETQVEISQ